MAYMCILASVRRERVSEIRTPADFARVASKTGLLSHYIVAACPEIEAAMDGGTPLETDTWHPLRGFRTHEPSAVKQHSACLAAIALDASHPTYSDDFVHAELLKMVELFKHASAAGEAVVTSLDLARTGKKQP